MLRKPKRMKDLHSRVAYRHQGPKPRNRLTMKIYEQWTGANYGKTEKTKTTLSARERAEAAFKPIISPFEPTAVEFTRAIVLPKKES